MRENTKIKHHRAVIYFWVRSILIQQKSSSPLLEILTSVTHDESHRHWFVITFSCGCIVIGALSLIEALQDGRRHLVKMANDGLLFKSFAANTKWSLLAITCVSVCLQAALSTFNLITLLAFAHLALDAHLGLIVVYRRYCIGSPISAVAARPINNAHQSLAANSPESDSDDTDVDQAVDEYKTQVFVSTVMEWNGLEMLSSRNPYRSSNYGTTSNKIKNSLFVIGLLVLIISLTMRFTTSYHPISISIVVVSFLALLLLLVLVWLHPQRARAQNAILKTPCVPWIPVLSSLSQYVLLLQLPIVTLSQTTAWILIGT